MDVQIKDIFEIIAVTKGIPKNEQNMFTKKAKYVIIMMDVIFRQYLIIAILSFQ